MLANTWNIFSVFNSCSNRPDCIHYRILQLAHEGKWNRFRTHSHKCNILRNNWKYSGRNISITIYGSNHNGSPLEFPIGYWTSGYWAIDNYVFIIKYIWYSRYIYILVSGLTGYWITLQNYCSPWYIEVIRYLRFLSNISRLHLFENTFINAIWSINNPSGFWSRITIYCLSKKS